MTDQTGDDRGSVVPEGCGRLLRVDEVAKLLGLSVGGVYHLVSQKRISVVRLSSRCIRFGQKSLSQWIEDLTQKAERFPECEQRVSASKEKRNKGR